MKKIRFAIERATISGCKDVAYVDRDESAGETVMQAVWRDLGIEIEVTISGVTMHAAAWEDPEHWADDWSTKLNVSYEEVGAAVKALLISAEEE